MFESSHASQAGLAAAVDVCRAIGPSRISEISYYLASRLRSRLAAVPGVELRGGCSGTGPLCAIVIFDAAAAGVESAAIQRGLIERKIGVSLAPTNHNFDDKTWSRPYGVRLSPTYFNTDEEVDAVVDAVQAVLSQLRRTT